MSTIGGPGGIGGPSGPGGAGGPDGPDGPDGPENPDDAEAATGADAADHAGDVGGVGDAGAIGAARMDALAADLAAGKLTPREAIDKMVDEAGAGLGQNERTELRELLTDLVENDPHLAALARQA